MDWNKQLFQGCMFDGGSFAKVEEALAHGADPNMVSEDDIGDKVTPLILAVVWSPDIVEALIVAGADVNKTSEDENSNTPLHSLQYYNSDVERQLAIIADLVSAGADVNAKNAFGYAPLHVLVQETEDDEDGTASTDVLTALIAAGADVDITDIDNDTPLHVACRAGTYANIVATLIAAGAEVDKENDAGFTALCFAVEHGPLQVVTTLIAAGADVNHSTAFDLGEESVIHFAVKSGDEEIVAALIAAGADVNVSNYLGETPLILAAEDNHSLIIEALLAAGAIVDKGFDSGETPLSIAARKGNLESVKKLIAGGADVNNMAHDNHIPLFHAAKKGHKNTVKTLLEAGADPDRVPRGQKDGKTIRELAASGAFTPAICASIVAAAAAAAAGKNAEVPWTGLTKSDVSKLDTIFDAEPRADGTRPPAEDWSLCPVCLGFLGRKGGCKYMKHDCKTSGQPWFHPMLYSKFKDDFGNISWCTVCGRICSGHYHYDLIQFNQPHKLVSIPLITETHVFYSGDCSVREGGGGLAEKFLRFRRFKEVARELNEEIGEITRDQALSRLVEQMWNAPLSTMSKKRMDRIRGTKEFNIPTANFPEDERPTGENHEELLEFRRVGGMEPQVFAVGTQLAAGAAASAADTAENALGFADSGDVIYFRHVDLHGILRDHFAAREGVGQAALVTYVAESLRSFGTDPNFGKCPWHGDGCDALLFPDEIKPFVPPELYEKYFVAFNRIYARRKKMGVAGYTLAGAAVGAVSAAAGAAAGAASAGAAGAASGGSNSDESNSDGSNTNGSNTNGSNTNGSNFDGSNTNGSNTNSSNTNGSSNSNGMAGGSRHQTGTRKRKTRKTRKARK